MSEMSRTKEKEREFLVEVIQAYRELPCLWKMKSSDYSNRHMKDEAYQLLLTKYRERYENATKEDLKKRLNSLRTNFRKELKKVDDSMRIGSNEVYVSTLWYFDVMSFLSDQEVNAQFDSMIKVETQSEDDEGDYIEDEPCQPMQLFHQPPQPHASMFITTNGTTTKRKNPETYETQDDMMSLGCKRLHHMDDEYMTLAKIWANEISKMDSRQQLFAKKAINDVIFEGQCGTLHRNSVQVNVTHTDTCIPNQHFYQ